MGKNSFSGLEQLTTFNFDYYGIYELVKKSIIFDILKLKNKSKIKKLSIAERNKKGFYEQSLAILIESTFLQLDAQLEEALYHKCEKKKLINKIMVFESLKIV
ncbi:hypothetical protein ACNVED_16195 (plasmid) [Legionella sp. D16C41]|uniref:hypothetical protein n=1 Tax=Legionella sp. D16C41 TaxID=3402688 RepID=UPI003AF8318B